MPMYYALNCNGAAPQIKQGTVFAAEGGLTEEWGNNWIALEAVSLVAARLHAARIFGVKVPSHVTETDMASETTYLAPALPTPALAAPMPMLHIEELSRAFTKFQDQMRQISSEISEIGAWPRKMRAARKAFEAFCVANKLPIDFTERN